MSMLHMTLDAYGIDAALLADFNHLERALADLPAVIGMQTALGPVCAQIETSNPNDAGISGFVIIATSHCSFHAWPPYGMLNYDIFSCEHFDPNRVVAHLHERFGFAPGLLEVRLIERAVDSPRPAPVASAVSPTPSHPAPSVGERLSQRTGAGMPPPCI